MEFGFVEGFVFHFSGRETENLFSVNAGPYPMSLASSVYQKPVWWEMTMIEGVTPYVIQDVFSESQNQWHPCNTKRAD